MRASGDPGVAGVAFAVPMLLVASMFLAPTPLSTPQTVCCPEASSPAAHAPAGAGPPSAVSKPSLTANRLGSAVKGHPDSAGTTPGPASSALSVVWGVTSAGPAPLNTTFQVFASGGVPPYNYTYSFGDGTPVLRNGSANASHTYEFPGIFNATIWVNDSVGDSYNGTVTITVVAHPLVVSAPVVFPSTVDLGQPVTFIGSATGGAPPYNYTWLGTGEAASGLPPGCSDPPSDFGFSPASNLTCTPTAAGQWPISVVVLDYAGEETLSNSSTLTVVAPPTFEGLTLSPRSIDLGQESNFTAEFSGGSGPLSYVWWGLPPGCQTANTSRLPCAPNVGGTYQINVSATDSTGVRTFGRSLPLSVSPSLSVLGTASSSVLDLGEKLQLGLQVMGGTGVYTIRWMDLPQGCESANSTQLTCTPTVTGSWWINATIEDTNGASIVERYNEFVVNPLPTVTIHASANPIAAGGDVVLQAEVNGGTRPYSFQWEGSPGQCEGPPSSALNCTGAAPGTYTIYVEVSDYLGGEASANLTLIVNASAASPSPFAALALSLGLGGGVVVVAAAVVLLRRRGKAPPPSTGPDPPPYD